MRPVPICLCVTAVALAAGVTFFAQRTPPAGAQPAPQKLYGEWRIHVKPDRGKEYDQLIAEKGLPIFRDAGGRMVGWWKTLSGDLYEHVTIWEYDGWEAFERAIARLGGDVRFAQFKDVRDPLLAGETNRFLRLASFAEAPPLPVRANFIVHEIHRVPMGKLDAYGQFMKEAVIVLRRHGFRPVGPWSVDSGRWSEATTLFLFDTLAERERKIAEFLSSGDAKGYVQGVGNLVDEVVTSILVPAPFAK